MHAFFLGIISAFSLLFGAVASFYWRPGDRVVAFLMALGGGALLAALTLDLVGEALKRGNLTSLCFGCFLGGVLFILLDIVVSDYGGFKRKAATTIYYVRGKKHSQYRQILTGIERTDIFRHLQSKHFKQLSASITSRDFKKGEIIYHPGDPAELLHVALSGEVRLFYREREARSSQDVSANQVFGLHAFLTGAPHVAGAAVLSDTTVLQIPRDAFNALLLNSATLQQVMHRWLREPTLIDYLHNEHRMSIDQADLWLDGAVQSLMNRGYIPAALSPRREMTRFCQLAESVGRTPLFSALPEDELKDVAGCLTYSLYEEGQTIFHQGDPSDRMYVLCEGEISLIDSEHAHGQPEKLRPADAFGCLSFLSGAKHTFSAIATRDSAVWVIRRGEFFKLLRHAQLLKKNVIHLMQSHEYSDYLESRGMLDSDKAEKFVQESLKTLEIGQTPPTVFSLINSHRGHQGAAMAIWLGILLDGIPESLVIGSSMIHSQVSLSLLAGLFIANFPESLSSSIGMRQQGFSAVRIVLMWGSIVLITGIGAALGNIYFTEAEPFMFTMVEGIAAGAMLTMIAQTMLPEAYFKGGSIVGFATLLGFLAAIASKGI